jgi:hypothetical protein
MECGPCVVYGRRILEGGFPSFLYEEILEEWRKKRLYEERKNNARECVKVMELGVFSYYYYLFSFSFALLSL